MALSNQNEEIGVMKPVTPVEYMLNKFPAVEFTFTFKKWHIWTKMAGENRYPMDGSFNKTKLDLVKEIIQTRKMDKKKGMKKSTLVSETVIGMMMLEGQIFMNKATVTKLKAGENSRVWEERNESGQRQNRITPHRHMRLNP